MTRPELADVATLSTAELDIACSHCGLSVPRGLREEGAELQFCCQGCRTVYAVIIGQGLGRYYTLRADDVAAGRRARVTAKTYAEFDDETFRAAYCRSVPGSERLATELYLEGVHCASCVWLVERAAGDLQGNVQARLDLGRASVSVQWDPRQVPLSQIARAFDAVGYPAHPLRDGLVRDLRRAEERSLLARIGVAGALAINVMLMALALYSDAFADMDASFRTMFRWGSLALTIPSYFWCGAVFLRGGLTSLRTRTLHMDLPIAIGLTAGLGWGAVNTVLNRGEIFFDSVAVLVFLLLLGRWIQMRQRRAASDAAELLYALAPSAVRRVEGDEVREIAAAAVQIGDLLEVRPGESIPADGTIARGRSTLDCALLTGESRPVDVGEGDSVHAGTVNLSDILHVRTEQTGTATRVGRLMQAVAEASRRRAPIVAFADRIVGRFVAVVLTIAALTLLAWLQLDPSHALDHAVALLVVTCPCALGLATPLAVHAAIGRAAREGILIKGGDAMERLAGKGLILFDKTGTLTQGRQDLLTWLGDEAAQPLVLAVERSSTHPVARALVAAFAHLQAPEPETMQHTLGGGIEATVQGRAVLVGSPAFVAQRTAASELADAWVQQVTAEAQTPVLIAVDGLVVGAMGLGDPLRPDAAPSLRALEALGFRVGLLSGDHPAVVAHVGAQLGLDPSLCRGGATPEDKLAAVQDALGQGIVFMVGDGVNDAAALAAATVGISVHGGAEASLQAADVFLTRPGVAPIVDVIRGARRTLRVIRRNILFSIGYNLIGGSLAVTGLLSPLIAAILMPFSSLTVVSSSYRSRTFGDR